jgi:tRNA pseudouridine(55) synthase
MASGKLLILVGDECKVQEKYHSLDKEYEVEVLFGVGGDTGDVLGIVTPCSEKSLPEGALRFVEKKLTGKITLPYPHFSSKTVRGKPLHTWTLEGRLHEIEVPVKESTIHKLSFRGLRTIGKDEVLESVRKKIETIPEVTDPKKALGEDFRRDAVRASWDAVAENPRTEYHILSFTCIASSGTYMRSLGERIAEELGTCGLAYSIHRTRIGRYLPLTKRYGFFTKSY